MVTRPSSTQVCQEDLTSEMPVHVHRDSKFIYSTNAELLNIQWKD